MKYGLIFSTDWLSHFQIQASHLQTAQQDVAHGLNRYRSSWKKPNSICRNASKFVLGVRDVPEIYMPSA